MDRKELAELLDYLNAGKTLASGSPMFQKMVEVSAETRRLVAEMNAGWREPEEIREFMARITGGNAGPGLRIFPPFFTDFGKNIRLGADVFINSGCCFQDQGGITIGDRALIGHQVVIATINHGMAADERADNRLAPVKIGANVWIGAHATILPGVTIGDNAIVAAGAVVHRDVAANSIVAGCPAKFVKNIPEGSRKA